MNKTRNLLEELQGGKVQELISTDGEHFVEMDKLKDWEKSFIPTFDNKSVVPVTSLNVFLGKSKQNISGARDEFEHLEKSKHMKSVPTTNSVIKAIENDQLPKAFEHLAQIIPADRESMLTQLRQRFSELKTNNFMGILSYDEYARQKAKITVALTSLVSDLKSSGDSAGSDIQGFSKEKIEEKKGQQVYEKAKIYFSYAWGDQTDETENIVDKLYNSLQKEGFQVLRDNINIAYGGLISEFMKKMGEGDLIVVFTGKNYVESEYCMFELLEIARNSKWDKAAFTQRILPVPLEVIRFDQPKVLLESIRYWEQKTQEWVDLYKAVASQLSSEQGKRFENVKEIHQNFSKLSDWLIDINASKTSLLSENDFEKVKEAIKERLNPLKQ